MPVKVFLLLIFFLVGVAEAAPAIKHWQTDNGVRVYFIAAPELPMVDVRVVLDAASARDGGQPGLAVLTNSMLSQGAGDLNADQIAERFDNLGAKFGSRALKDMAIVSLRSLTEPKLLKPALDTMALVLGKPVFPADALERKRNQVLLSIKSRGQSPGTLAREAFYKAIYGQHPYANMSDGTMESVTAISREDIQAFHQRYYVAKNAIIAIVGALTQQQAEQLANKVSSQLASGEAAAGIAKVSSLEKSEEVRIQHPSTQTTILAGLPTIIREDPDRYALYLGNHILGGSAMVSIMTDEIREKRGLSYSAYSAIIPMRERGPFYMSLQTKNESAAEAIEVMRQTLGNFLDKGPSEEALEAAKKNISGGFPLTVASNKKQVEILAMIAFYNLPLDYLETYTDKINAVTLEQIKMAFKRHVIPDKMVTVIVGNSE
jgi:zinc protease